MSYLYNALSLLEVLFCLLVIEKYFFLGFSEVGRKRNYWIIGISTLAIAVGVGLDQKIPDISLLFTIITYLGIIIFIERKKFISGVVHIVPILGMLISIFIIPAGIGYLSTGDIGWILEEKSIFTIGMDVVFAVLVVLFFFLGKNWRRHSRDLTKNRTINKGESRILNICGSCLLVFDCVAVSVDELGWEMEKRKIILFLLLFIIIMLDVTILTTVVQRNQRFQYQKIAELNQFYLNAEIEHFRDYQRSQQETRKVKHDMKNHLYILGQLLEKAETVEALEYVRSLNEKVERIDQDIYSGNDIVDAIISAKEAKARQLGNEITVEGRLPLDLNLEPVELCTIFANALDNALEELERMGITGQTIEVMLQRQNEILMLLFSNPCMGKKKLGITSKKDSINHGLGLINIEEVVTKNNGIMKTEIESRNNEDYYLLQIIFPCKNHLQQ